MKGGFNLSRWALQHIPLIRYLMVVLLIGGVLSYNRLGQDEDPPFTFRAMVVRANWPGATALQMADQVTDKLEKKLQETPFIDRIRSYSKPGETLIILELRESTPPREVQNAWYQVRKKIGDIRGTLPGGRDRTVLQRRIRRHLRLDLCAVRRRFHLCGNEGLRRLRAPAAAARCRPVSKVEQFGVQDEKIYIEFSHKQFAQLGIPFEAVVAQINAQNAVESTGVLVTPTDNLQVRVTGALRSIKDLENLQLRANGTTFRLGDFATIKRGFRDPPQDKMRFNGREVIGLGVSMERGGNIIELGKDLQSALADIRGKLPVGIELQQVTNQPRGGGVVGQRVRPRADRSGADRAGGELHRARPAYQAAAPGRAARAWWWR